LRELDVFGIGFRTADFDETAAHGANFKFVVAQHFGGVELSVVPGAFYELDHKYAKALPDCAESGTEGAGGFSFARSGVDNKQTFFFWHGASGSA
jgi:hypothetical protein